MPYKPDIHHRNSIRLREYDYTRAGGYFVTICTFGRECLFGDVVDGLMRLNEFGKIVHEEWLKSADIRKEVSLDSFVIMPNHMHGIILIKDNVGAHGVCPMNDMNGVVGAHGMRPDSMDITTDGALSRAPLRKPKSLGAFVAGFKSAVTKRINAIRNNPGCPVWQRNYYEHVTRNDDDLNQIRQYIMNNPMKWELDENNPVNLKT